MRTCTCTHLHAWDRPGSLCCHFTRVPCSPPYPHSLLPFPTLPPLPHPLLPFPISSSPSQVSTAAMQSILKRMQFQDYIQIVSFSDYIILNKPIEEWPLCDCLIAFYSKGFPLDKAIAYVNLRHPFVINDLEMQYNLMDR